MLKNAWHLWICCQYFMPLMHLIKAYKFDMPAVGKTITQQIFLACDINRNIKKIWHICTVGKPFFSSSLSFKSFSMPI